jgi:uncharacterized Zn-binding protein involved in type VI secretion
MPLIARGNGVDIVNTGHDVCLAPGQIATLSCSPNVFVAGVGIHREGDTNTPHTHCPPVYSTQVVTFSPNVFANGLHVARQGDTYSCTAFVETVTQGTVFAN